MYRVKVLNPLTSKSQQEQNRFQFEFLSILSWPCYEKSIINEFVVEKNGNQSTIQIQKSSIGKAKGNKLRYIKLRFLISSQYQSIFFRIFQRIVRCLRFLSVIRIVGSRIGDLWLEAICRSNFPFLVELSMRSDNITSEGIQNMQICNWKHLRRLDLSNNPLKNKGLSTMMKVYFPHLHYLDLRFCKFTPLCVKSLLKGLIPCLKYLDLTGNKMGDTLQEKIVFNGELETLRTLKMLDYSYVEKTIRVSRPIFTSGKQNAQQLKISVDPDNYQHYAHVAGLRRRFQYS